MKTLGKKVIVSICMISIAGCITSCSQRTLVDDGAINTNEVMMQSQEEVSKEASDTTRLSQQSQKGKENNISSKVEQSQKTESEQSKNQARGEIEKSKSEQKEEKLTKQESKSSEKESEKSQPEDTKTKSTDKVSQELQNEDKEELIKSEKPVEDSEQSIEEKLESQEISQEPKTEEPKEESAIEENSFNKEEEKERLFKDGQPYGKTKKLTYIRISKYVGFDVPKGTYVQITDVVDKDYYEVATYLGMPSGIALKEDLDIEYNISLCSLDEITTFGISADKGMLASDMLYEAVCGSYEEPNKDSKKSPSNLEAYKNIVEPQYDETGRLIPCVGVVLEDGAEYDFGHIDPSTYIRVFGEKGEYYLVDYYAIGEILVKKEDIGLLDPEFVPDYENDLTFGIMDGRRVRSGDVNFKYIYFMYCFPSIFNSTEVSETKIPKG